MCMTHEEENKKIEEIYNKAISEMESLISERNELVKERQDKIKNYIKDLENKKMDAIRASIHLVSNN